jgi:hypothetical protein
MELLPLTQNSSNILIYVIMFFIIVVGIIFGFIAIHKKKSKIEAWVFVRNACWLIGGGMTGFATVVFDIQLGTGGFAIFSLGFAIHAIVLSLKSEQRIRSLEIKEINRKLLMLKEENDANIQLINDLIQKKEHFYPEHLLNKKLKQSPPEKYKLTLDELKILSKAGVWIPKEKFSYDSALHVLEIAYQLDDNFIEKVREYIRVGKKLNVYKDFCQQWILTRNGIPNPDETYNYYNSLDDAKKTTVLMKNLLKKELKRFETSDIII